MASETLEIAVVEDGNGTNKLVTAVNNLAKAAETVADATDKSSAASRTASTARTQEAAATDRAATAAKGYVDAQGNYIRQVGSQANSVRQAATSQDTLTKSVAATTIEAGRAAAGYGPLNTAVATAGKNGQEFAGRVQQLNGALNGAAAPAAAATNAVRSYVDAQGNLIRLVGSQANATVPAITAQNSLTTAISATSIEAGRAAAGYGPLNGATVQAGAASAAFNARVAELNAALTGTAAPAATAAAAVGSTGQATQTANGWIAQYRQSLYGIAPAGQAAAGGSGAAGGGAGGAGNQARTATGFFTGLGQSFRNVGSAASGLSGALSALGIGLTAAAVIKYSDNWNSVQNKLRLVTTDQGKLNDMMKAAMDIAQKTYTPFDAVAQLYGKISQSALAYRLSGKDVIDITTSLALAFQVSGASGVEAGRAIEQFSQGLSKGKLELQDFKSMVQASPAVVNALTLGLRTMGVSISGGLGNALSQGTVSAKQMLQSLIAVRPVLEAFAAGTIPTVAQSFTFLENAFTQYIGTSARGQQTIGLLSSAIIGLASNLNYAVPAALALGAVLTFGMVAGAISSIAGLTVAIAGLISTMATGLVGAITAVGVAIAANPLLAGTIAVAVAAGATAIYMFRGAIGDALAGLLGFNTNTSLTEQVMAKAKSAGEALAGAMDKVGVSTKKAGGSALEAGQYYNQLGEKLESFATVKARWDQMAQQEAQHMQQLNDMLRQYWNVNDAANNAVVALNSTVGLFVGTIDNANARLSQGQSALSGYAQGLGQLGGAYDSAASSAAAFGNAVQFSNTVAGQIGTSTASGLTALDDEYGDARFWGNGGSMANMYSPAQMKAMRQSYYNQQQAIKAVDAARTQSIVNAALKNAGYATGGTFVVGNDNHSPVRNVERFASGGNFMVGGSGSTDSQLVQFLASPNERVTIETPSQAMRKGAPSSVQMPDRRAKMVANIVVKADDFGQFKRSQRQIAQDIGERIVKAS